MYGIESIKNIPTLSNTSQKAPEIKTEDNKKQYKFDNKKVIATLVSLGIAATAGIAIIAKAKSGKQTDLNLEKFKEIGHFEKGQAFVKNKPYTGIINVVNKNGIFALKYENGKLIESINTTSLYGIKQLFNKKVYSISDKGEKIIKSFSVTQDGKERLISKTQIGLNEIKTTKQTGGIELSSGAIKKQITSKDNTVKNIWQPYMESERLTKRRNVSKIITINPKTGEEIAKPRYAVIKPVESRPSIRKTTNGVTYKNGAVLATKTQSIDEKGNKIITIDYGTKGEKIITVTPEGKRSIVDNTKKFIDL